MNFRSHDKKTKFILEENLILITNPQSSHNAVFINDINSNNVLKELLVVYSIAKFDADDIESRLVSFIKALLLLNDPSVSVNDDGASH